MAMCRIKRLGYLRYIENFRAVYGALTGPLVMALPGRSSGCGGC